MRTLHGLATFCLMIAPLPAIAQTSQPTAPEEAEAAAVDIVALDEVAPDTSIESRLTKIFRATGWFEGVRVEARDGVVFLTGSAADHDRKEWAAELARNTQGVAAVVNRMDANREVDFPETLAVVTTSLRTLWEDFLAHCPLLVAGMVALMLTALVGKFVPPFVARIGKRSGLRSSVQDLILQLLTIGIWVVGLLVAAVITFPGMTAAKALTVLGLGSVAVGFAFKDIFENFFAGILILWKYPFDKGDFIECGDIKGRIEQITVRMSMIRQVDGQLVVVPNAMLFKNAVDVLTDLPARRTTVICGVAYGEDLDEAREVIQTAVEACSTVRKDDPVEIFAQEFADSSINFEVTWWTGATPTDIRESRDEVVRAVKQALDRAGIEIPFPYRTLTFKEPLKTEHAELAEQSN